MKKIFMLAFTGAILGVLGAYFAERIISILSSVNVSVLGSIAPIVYKTFIGLFVGSAGAVLEKFSVRSMRQPAAGALSLMLVTIICPVSSVIGGWFMMSFCMAIFACSISLAVKLSARNAVAGVVGGVAAGIAANCLLWKTGGVAVWGVAGFLIWLSIGIAEIVPVPDRTVKVKKADRGTGMEGKNKEGKEGAGNGTGDRKMDG